jgi:hypothetical protein
MPARPFGKVKEKSLCSPCLLRLPPRSENAPDCRVTAAIVKRIPQARNLLLPLSWYCVGSVGTLGLSQLDDAATQGYGDCLRAVAGSEFLHDVLDVDLDGLFRDEEPLRNVPVAVPAGDVA